MSAGGVFSYHMGQFTQPLPLDMWFFFFFFTFTYWVTELLSERVMLREMRMLQGPHFDDTCFINKTWARFMKGTLFSPHWATADITLQLYLLYYYVLVFIYSALNLLRLRCQPPVFFINLFISQFILHIWDFHGSGEEFLFKMNVLCARESVRVFVFEEVVSCFVFPCLDYLKHFLPHFAVLIVLHK